MALIFNYDAAIIIYCYFNIILVLLKKIIYNLIIITFNSEIRGGSCVSNRGYLGINLVQVFSNPRVNQTQLLEYII